MPVTCIVLNCGSRSNRDNVHFFVVPRTTNFKTDDINALTKLRREKWLAAINRYGLTESIIKYQRVCSKHFISGKPADLQDINHPDWVPSQNMDYNTGVTPAAIGRKNRLDNRKRLKIGKASMPQETTKPDVRKEANVINAAETSVSLDKEVEECFKENQDSNNEATDSNNEATEEPTEEPAEELVRCRTCLALTNKASCLQLTSDLPSIEELRDMLISLVGPMDLDTPVKPFMCFKCEKILRLSHSFKMRCGLIEEGLKELKSRGSTSTGSRSKSILRSSVNSSKRYRVDDSPTNISSKRRKMTNVKDDHEVDVEKYTMLILKEIEKDTRIDVDGDLVGIIENEINSSEDTNVKNFLNSKFKSDPGVKIVPYIIPRQIICITPNMFEELESNNRNNSQHIANTEKDDIMERRGSLENKSVEMETASMTTKRVVAETDVSVNIEVEHQNTTSHQSQNVVENAASKVGNEDRVTIVTEVETADADIETESFNVDPVSESEEAGDFFEDFEPDWFKAAEKKRRSRKKKDCETIVTEVETADADVETGSLKVDPHSKSKEADFESDWFKFEEVLCKSKKS